MESVKDFAMVLVKYVVVMSLGLSLLFALIGISTGEILTVVICVLVFVSVLAMSIYVLRYFKAKCDKRVSQIEDTLTIKGFNVSRKIGCYHFFDPSVSSWFLYVDDVNKKWLMTAPLHPVPDMIIRNFEDLLGFDFFDGEANNVFDTLMKGIKMGGLITNPTKYGETNSYGLALRTTDCNAVNPVLKYDFMQTGEPVPAKSLRMPRTHHIYKKNMEIIQEMGEVIEYIIRSNAN